jgi:glyoxylase-like metal-dependent hydrolase (beta-lactamase superfamily II)
MPSREITRRTLLKGAAALGGAASRAGRLLARMPDTPKSLAAYRAELAAKPIEEVKLTNLITMFSGPGGNVVVRHGDFDKVVVDTFVQGAFPALKQRLDAMSNAPILYVINTNWAFDHTDNNESFRKTGAEIVAHENTKRRLSEPHDHLGMHFAPVPQAALPTQTFKEFRDVKLEVPPGLEEYVDLGYLPRAHNDTAIYAHFVIGDVLHLGDTFLNGMYPFIDADMGGSIGGLIAAVEGALKGVNPRTKIVPGHGPLADRAALVRYRDMLATVRDRVEKLKTAGRSEKEAVAAKPTMELDAAWAQGFVQPDEFVSMIYKTL